MEPSPLHLLDANVLITANRDYYPIDMVPEFWAWILHMARAGVIKMPLETFEEVRDGKGKAKKDALVDWLNTKEVADHLVFDEEANAGFVGTVLAKGYAPDLTDLELEIIGCDPFLIAYALVAPKSRVVVTIEASAPSKKRQNRRVPDVCTDCGLTHCNTFGMLKALGFRTSWQEPHLVTASAE